MSGPIVGFVHSSMPGSLVWDAVGVYELRSRWRVVGGLGGCLPGLPRQSSQLGLPLLLSPEETTVLRERGVLEVKEYSPPMTSSEDIKTFHELREKETQLQFEFYQKRRRELSEKHSTHDPPALPPLPPTDSNPPPPLLPTDSNPPPLPPTDSNPSPLPPTDSNPPPLPPTDSNPPPPLPPTDSNPPLPPPPTKSNPPLPHPLLFSPLIHTLTGDPRVHTSPTHFPAADWTYPHTPHQKLQYSVFRDLWLRGFTLTTADKYGGDYLVYTGDPALVHSRYIALVLPWKQPIRMLSVACRLGSKVAKSVLLCSVDNEENVHYTTVEWAG